MFFLRNNNFTASYKPDAVPVSTIILSNKASTTFSFQESKYPTTTAKTCTVEMSVLLSIIMENFWFIQMSATKPVSSKAIPSWMT